ncbi:MAG: BON domain-containing protein [Planctomycetes bacterium]|nr:BON domain-containing protein [Planctomycetota bacterium]
MLTRLTVLTAAFFLLSQVAMAQFDVPTGTGGTTTNTGGTTTTTGTNTGTSTTGTSTETSVTTPATPGVGQLQNVNVETLDSTVETSRQSGLTNLSGSTLQNTTAGGQNQLPGGSQFGGGRNQGTNRNTQRGGGTSSRSIRPSLRLGFTPVVRPSADVSRAVSRSFSRIATRTARIGETNPALRNVRIVPGKAGQLTLTGIVPTASARRLAANILRMEPGVRSVTNNLTVVQVQPSPLTTGGSE